MRSKLISILAALTLCLLLGAALPALADQTVVGVYSGNLPFTGDIQGKVTVGTGTYVDGALVTAWRIGASVPPAWGVWDKKDLPPGIAKRFAKNDPLTWTTTDGGGAYTLSNLPGGTYVISVSAPWYLPWRATVRVAPGSTVTQNVYLRGEFGSVGGVVYDVYNNKPLNRATVVLFTYSNQPGPLLQGNQLKMKNWKMDITKDFEEEELDVQIESRMLRIARTDETGVFVLNAPPGTYQFLAVRPGYKPVHKVVTVAAKKLTRMDVGMTGLPQPAPKKVEPQKSKAQKANGYGYGNKH
ncbi:MAG: carboxypeptidase-like regulatory domain-containing protein [Bacillota bacterium]